MSHVAKKNNRMVCTFAEGSSWQNTEVIGSDRALFDWQWDDESLCEEEERQAAEARSPMQELFIRGLLHPIDADTESEEQASWQAGRAFRPVRPCEDSGWSIHRYVADPDPDGQN
jgi:hypothetical protein